MSDELKEVISLATDNAALRQRVEELEEIVNEVWIQCGDYAPDDRRHALTPGLRIKIRGCLRRGSVASPSTEQGGQW